MVTRIACHFGLIGCLALMGISGVEGGDIVSWQVGDTASEDIATPINLDIVDAKATAARKAELDLKIPAIFETHASVTNDMIVKVTESFDQAHANFVAGLTKNFHQSVLDEATIQSTDFARYVVDFNVRNERFLVTAALARQWARGESGLDTRTDLIELLLKTTSRPVRPDETPDGFVLGQSVRLVPVHSSSDVVTLKNAEKNGTVVSLSSVTTVSRLRGLFRRNFSSAEQDFARQLSTYIHPDCVLDTELSEKARAQEAAKVVFVNHYAPGQIIVRRGQVIDDRVHAALAKLNQQLAAKQTLLQTSVTASQTAVQDQGYSESQNQNQNLKNPAQNIWVVAAVAGGSVVLLMGLGMMVMRRRTTGLARQTTMPLPPSVTLPAELAPQIAQALRSAVTQELAVQRQELLLTQQTAATEVLRLMQRLNELHAPWQERLAAYETRIHELEKELSLRTEENRELLKLKIELLRHQLETERGNPRVKFN